MLAVLDFTYGPLNPVLAFIACCGGVFLALRSTSRALDRKGSARAQWLLMGGVTLGAVGFWAMHMIALLGFTIRGDTVYYSIPLTLASLLVAMVTATIGLALVGFRPRGYASLAGAGLITGAGLLGMQYLGFASLQAPAKLSYEMGLVTTSIVIGFVAAVAVLAAAVRLRQPGPTVAASLIAGVVLLVMHYTGMMAIQAHRPAHPVAIFMGGPHSTTAQSFLLPLILGIGTICFLVSAAIALWPGAEEIRYDAALLDHIGKRNQHGSSPLSSSAVILRPQGSGSGAGRGRGAHTRQWTPPATAPPPRSPVPGPPPRRQVPGPPPRGPSTGPQPQRAPATAPPAQQAPGTGPPLQQEPATGRLPMRIPRNTPPAPRAPATGPRTQWADSTPAADEETTSWSFAELQLRKPPEPR
jgi:NO-binding membrane sensor protein with MHYT domain